MGQSQTLGEYMKLQRYVYCTKPSPIDGTVNGEGSESADAGWMHYCPACGTMHAIAVEHPFANGAKWTFNGDMEKPTFAPSVKIEYTSMKKPRVCHYHIKEGVIEYCNDCTHELASKKVPLPLIPEHEL